jgi:RNA polymerase sigma-70 factor (ECF subfamily)
MSDPLADSIVLVRQAKAGDADALNDLLKRYSPRVLEIVRIRLGASLREKLESQDIVQEAFVRAVKNFDRFELRHEKAVLHWLGELALNAIRDRYDYHRAAMRDMYKEKPLDRVSGEEDGKHDPEDRLTPSRFVSGQEELLNLAKALDELPQDARDVVVFRDVEQLEFKEIAEFLGRTEDAARMLYVRAKVKLSKRFESE